MTRCLPSSHRGLPTAGTGPCCHPVCRSRTPRMRQPPPTSCTAAGGAAEPMQLHNTYWLMRHGRSRANEAKLIVSRLENGVKPEYSLSPAGVEQARAAGKLLGAQLGEAFDYSRLAIYASPFSRTLKTAQLASEQLRQPVPVQPAAELRERDFGAYELQTDDNYPTVWARDAASTSWKPTPDGAHEGAGETVEEVAARFVGLLDQLEDRHWDFTILLVAHGDTLSIGTAAIRNRSDMRQHKQSFYLGTAEMMQLN